MNKCVCLFSFLGFLGILGFITCNTTVQEGSVGIYYRFGRLLPDISDPGIHFKFPYPVTKMSLVDVRPQVDEIQRIQCVSNDKLSIEFPMIKVFNQLRAKDVYSMINAFGENYDSYLITEQVRVKVVEMCTIYSAEDLYTKEFSKLNDIIFSYLKEMQDLHKSNLTITHVLVEKLVLPKEVMLKYERVGTEKATIEAEIQSQLRQIKVQETLGKIEQMKAITQAEQERIKAENEALVLAIRTNAEALAIKEIASANSLKNTEQYIQLEAIKAWGAIDKVYFGNSIPEIMYNPQPFVSHQ
jgi:regulator of protease activity HflC (stomatin/prohibitin superfamily)